MCWCGRKQDAAILFVRRHREYCLKNGVQRGRYSSIGLFAKNVEFRLVRTERFYLN